MMSAPHTYEPSLCIEGLRSRKTANKASSKEASSAKDESKVSSSSSKSKLAKPGPVWSSGVPFYPPSDKFWRIGNKWYDFTDFLEKHPGGADVLETARDRFEDSTFLFESHHHDYKRARAIIRKYEVSEETAIASGLIQRPTRDSKKLLSARTHFDKALDMDKHPHLLGDDSFYSVLRMRVTEHLKSVGCKNGEPTWTCVFLFWAIFAAWVASVYNMWRTGSFLAAAMTGPVASWLGGYGHNWAHQPKYKNWGWAILSLDTVGFSSEAWYREHNMQHHMYTNTPWDNHFRGTDPFLVTDPTIHRHPIQKYIMPYISPILLCFGISVNYIVHVIELLQGNERFSIGLVCLPLHYYFLMSRWGLIRGFFLMFTMQSIVGMYYFTIALMNHNSAHTHDVKSRNAAKDWGHAQLHASADWNVNLTFLQAWIYLWLNFHTVHHRKYHCFSLGYARFSS
jgi:cytochrome b involved in lipid metabolism